MEPEATHIPFGYADDQVRELLQKAYPQGRRPPESVVVYGPPGCGKTRNAQALARHFGLRLILDGAEDPSAYPILLRGALYLSTLRIEGIRNEPFSPHLVEMGLNAKAGDRT